MDLKNRDLITIDDLTNCEIESIFSLTDDMPRKCRSSTDSAPVKLWPPFSSSRARARGFLLNRQCTASAAASSPRRTRNHIFRQRRKHRGYGADCRQLCRYYRHAPSVGRRGKLMADYASVPVINAGDGGHQHPTQTLMRPIYTEERTRRYQRS